MVDHLKEQSCITITILETSIDIMIIVDVITTIIDIPIVYMIVNYLMSTKVSTTLVIWPGLIKLVT